MKTEQLPVIELGYQEGTSDKIYRASIEAKGTGFVVNFAFGRRGSSMNVGTKTPDPVSLEVAVSIYENLVDSKLDKGYTPTDQAARPELDGKLSDIKKRDTGLRAMLLNPITEDDAAQYLRDSNWCAQEKFDGKRIMLRKTGLDIIPANRRGQSTGFPSALSAQMMQVQGDYVVDGELVGDRFYAFDLLENKKGDLRTMPYKARLEALQAQFGKLSGDVIVAETAFGKAKEKLMARLRAAKKEGIVFKHVREEWNPGRPASGGCALKCKFWASCSCIVIRANTRRSVEIALDGMTVGNVTIPLNHEIPSVGQVVEIRYLYVNGAGGALYQPVYLGQRDDVTVRECTVAKQNLKYKGSED
jgi:bifunctional non-homologous end joining protein LigD